MHCPRFGHVPSQHPYWPCFFWPCSEGDPQDQWLHLPCLAFGAHDKHPKDCCLAQPIQAIHMNSALPVTKHLALSSRFMHLPLAATWATQKLISLDELWTPGVFHVINTKVLDDIEQLVNIVLQLDLTAGLSCLHCKYLSFHCWAVHPTQLHPACTGGIVPWL